LFDFVSKQGLRREGGNLFSQTRQSGEPQSGPPALSGMGTINSNALEQSNVDLAREFVHMITTQRGFQANSKVVTTTDIMLEVVVNMKR
jgi:flagellar hook protein FlgE